MFSPIDPGHQEEGLIGEARGGEVFGEPAAMPGWQPDDQDWAPPADPCDAEGLGSSPGLVANPAVQDEPRRRNFLPTQESGDAGRSGGQPGATDPRQTLASTRPEALAGGSEQPWAGAEVIVQGRVRAPIPGLSNPARRPSAAVVPAVVLALGVGIAAITAVFGGDQIMAGLALGLSLVGALLLRVFLRG